MCYMLLIDRFTDRKNIPKYWTAGAPGGEGREKGQRLSPSCSALITAGLSFRRKEKV